MGLLDLQDQIGYPEREFIILQPITNFLTKHFDTDHDGLHKQVFSMHHGTRERFPAASLVPIRLVLWETQASVPVPHSSDLRLAALN